ncbi:MAG: electron transfer flavoprotein subunit beta/FixA family protein [Desulfobacteraceae bacterium]|nr:MAG: electron transfer flavoprotein subunit beta/FixA family protein [Desulfobacteraceae bacterium]
MNILVCIKAVPDPEQVIHVEGGAPLVFVDDSTDLRMNHYDEFAIEMAVLIKEKYPEAMVEAITMGPEAARKPIKRAIGMGADKGIHILCDYSLSCDAAAVSGCIARIADKKSFDLILCGIMSEDMMQFQAGPMLARRLSIPWATAVIHVSLNFEDGIIPVERELEGGVTAMMDIRLPALLTIQSGINEPRYPALSKLLRADASRIQVIPAETLMQPGPRCQTVAYGFPEKKRAGLVLEGPPDEKAKKLLQLLREKTLL